LPLTRAFGFRVRPPLFSVTLFTVQSEVKLPPRMVTLPAISQDLTKVQVCPAVTVMSPLKVPVREAAARRGTGAGRCTAREVLPRLIGLPERQAILGIISKVGHDARFAVDVRLFLARSRLTPCASDAP
jgi:hypothetical protein